MSARHGERGAVAAMVGATLIWGGTFVAIRDTVRGMPPQSLVCGRFLGAALLLAVVGMLRRRAPSRADWFAGAGSGVLMAVAFTLQALGLKSTSAGSSAFLTCAGTLQSAFFAWLLLRERLRASLLAGILLALAGSALLSLDGALRLGHGELITLAGAVVFALQVVWISRHGSAVDAASMVTVQSAVIALLLAPFSGSLKGALVALSPGGWASFAYLAVAGSAIAPMLQVIAQARLSAGRVGLLMALEPVFALLFALAIGGERFAPRWWAGAGLILSAVMLVEWRAASTTSPSASR